MTPAVAANSGFPQLPSVPWRDPQGVSPEKLAGYIVMLEQSCLQHPESADLRTCLGMAHAMNYDVYSAFDALEEAIRVAPTNFFAQLKYAELFSRLRAMDRAETETLRALDLANNSWEMSLARKQLLEIRTATRKGVVRTAWAKPVTAPLVLIVAILAIAGFMIRQGL